MNVKDQSRRCLHTAVLVALLGACPVAAYAGENENVGALQKKLNNLAAEVEALRAQIAEQQAASEKVDIVDIQKRLDKAELHSSTDRIQWSVDARTRADSIHYSGVKTAPAPVVSSFFTPAAQGGFNGATPQQIQQAMGQMAAAGMVPPADEQDIDNDSIWTNRVRLGMKAKVNENIDFQGRIASYKVFGDSTGVKVYNGMNDVTFDGNTASLPHGDELRLERAYFNVKDEFDSMPWNISFGRRPSTEGSPLEFLNNGEIGGSPLAHIINWQFDGASASIGLEEATGIPGFDLKACWGVGFESGWANDPMNVAGVDDVQLGGFIAQLYDDGSTVATLNYAHAWDITDGFAGETVQPFYVATNPDGSLSFIPNSGSFISTVYPETEIGDWDAVNLLLTHNMKESLGVDVNVFLSSAFSYTNPSRVSNIAYYNMMGQGLLNSNGSLDDHGGYSIYAGVNMPVYNGSRFGFEYNYGSKYWFNFTGAEDSLVGSKLAVRGHVLEAYFHQPVYKENFFLTLGTRYYMHDYTGSGTPLGNPVEVNQATALDSINPVLDEVWDVYLAATLRI